MPVPFFPEGVAVHPSGTRVYVGDSFGSLVSVIDTATNTVTATFPCGSSNSTHGLAVNPEGTRLYMASLGKLCVIDTDPSSPTYHTVVATLTAGSALWGVAINPSGSRVYVTDSLFGNVLVIDTATNTVVDKVSLGMQVHVPEGVVVSPSGARVYVANDSGGGVADQTLLVIDTGSNTVIDTLRLGLRSQGVAVNSSGTRLYVTNIVDTAGKGSVSVIDTNTNTVIDTVPVGNSPYGIAVHPSDTAVYVANLSSNNVSVIDTDPSSPTYHTVIATVPVGSAPKAFGQFIVPASTAAPPPFPVIFVHGIASSSQAWLPLSDFLIELGWTFGGFPTLNPATGEITSVFPGDFYTMNFSDFSIPNFFSQHLGLDRQGWELAAIIQAVLDVNPGKTKVILIAHSMGGLAAREYLQGLARLNEVSPTIPYRGDVAQLITVGTPHLGSELAVICQSLSDVCLLTTDLGGLGIDPESTAVSELRPDSPALVRLNVDFVSNPLPNDVRYGSIVGFGTDGLVGLDHDGDGIVTRDSQKLLAGIPGLIHELREIFIPDREDCGVKVVFVFGETHTCEPGDAGVRTELLRQLRPVPDF